MTKNHLVSGNHQMVLGFLSRNSDKELYEREIARKVGISYGSANAVLNELYSDGLIIRNKRGKMIFYRIEAADPIFRPLKILNTLAMLRPLVQEMKHAADKVVLYGSCSRGDDTSESDIDLFIVTGDKEQAGRIIRKHSFGKPWEGIRLQPVLYSPLELLGSEKKDREFLSLVREGIVLWERRKDEPGIPGVP
jgi:predicted nucleotidyltransferase